MYMYMYIYIYVCVYIYIYTYMTLSTESAGSEEPGAVFSHSACGLQGRN